MCVFVHACMHIRKCDKERDFEKASGYANMHAQMCYSRNVMHALVNLHDSLWLKSNLDDLGTCAL